MHNIKVAIVGASGYSGIEILRILNKHPNVEDIVPFSSQESSGKKISELYPIYKDVFEKKCRPFSPDACHEADIVFLALPSGNALSIAPKLTSMKKKVIDLSGDFRLQDAVKYKEYYKQPHTAQELLEKAVYGLSEINRSTISTASFVSNPGCYPTSILLPLIPLLKENILSESPIIINAFSGVSGAGRKATLSTSFCEVNENIYPYKVGSHQHIPEIEQTLNLFSTQDVHVVFTPYLIPITRGILATSHAKLIGSPTKEDILDILINYYKNDVFIRILEDTKPSIQGILNTNFVDIGIHIDQATNTISLFSAIDNIIKGAAGQAVQNFNIMYHFKETEGLL